MRATLALVGAVLLAACSTEAPSTQDYRHRFEVLTEAEGNAEIVDAAVRAINRAESIAWVAADRFDSDRMVDALVAAAARGVDVRVVGDADRRDQPSFVRLLAELPDVMDTGELVPAVRFGNGALAYSPSPDVVVERDGDDSAMTHNFVVVDELFVIGATDGFIDDRAAAQVGFEAASEWIGRDFGDEFRQLHAGVFATTLNTFNGPLKSDTNNRQFYRTDDGRIELYFGPQERLMKQIIDDVYAARASVLVAAEFIANSPLADALRYKAEAGFDVTVVVAERSNNVTSSRYQRLVDAFDGLDNARIVALPDVDGALPFAFDTVVIDELPSPVDGRTYRAQAWVVTQTMVADISFIEVGEDETEARASDAFTDAHAFVVQRPLYESGSLFDRVASAARSVVPAEAQ